MAKPPFPWIGSKEKLAPYILPAFPPKLRQYVEPFGGSGAVLLALPRFKPTGHLQRFGFGVGQSVLLH